MINKVSAFFEKIENRIAVLLVIILCTLPFVQLISERILSTPIIGIDLVMVNLVFSFACFASIITWRKNKHICIAAIDELAPAPVKKVANIFKAIVIPCILIALFFAAFSNFFTLFDADNKVWGIPMRLFFSLLSLSYLTMIIMAVAKKENKLFSIIGLVLGLFISAGPIGGVLFFLFGLEELTFFYSIWDVWMQFATDAFPALIIMLIIFAFLGVPLFLIISAITYVAFSQIGYGYVETLSTEAYAILTDKSIAAIPLFTIAGYILSKGSAGSRLVEIFNSLFGWFRGGAVVATVIVAAFFTTITGVSGVTILALGSLLTIVLTTSGYSKDKAQSLITSSGTLGLLFPPSLAIIMYGTTNYFSVDVFDLFKGAVIPGIFLSGCMIALGIYYDKSTTRTPFSRKNALHAFKHGIFEMLLPVFIIGGYFGGILSLFQAAAFSVLYAFVIGVWVRKDYTVKKAIAIIVEALPITGGILCIFGAAKGLSYFFLDANIPELLSEFITTFVHSKYLFLLLLNCVLLVVGCLMDIYSAILIVSPLLIPIAESFGIHPVHTGVIFLMNMQLGFLTPPVGMDLFISSYAFNKPVMKVVRGILPFLLVQLIVVLLITYIPWFTTALL